jgi:hypothetical protein
MVNVAKKNGGSLHYMFERQLERLWTCSAQDLARVWVRAGYDWVADREAVKHGFFAAFRWAWLDTWTPELEAMIERDWIELGTDLEWDDVSVLVRHGWNEGRRHVTGYPHAQSGDAEDYAYAEGVGA